MLTIGWIGFRRLSQAIRRYVLDVMLDDARETHHDVQADEAQRRHYNDGYNPNPYDQFDQQFPPPAPPTLVSSPPPMQQYGSPPQAVFGAPAQDPFANPYPPPNQGSTIYPGALFHYADIANQLTQPRIFPAGDVRPAAGAVLHASARYSLPWITPSTPSEPHSRTRHGLPRIAAAASSAWRSPGTRLWLRPTIREPGDGSQPPIHVPRTAGECAALLRGR